MKAALKIAVVDESPIRAAILHFGCEIVQRLTEKVLATRVAWAQQHWDILIRLMTAISRGPDFVACEKNFDEASSILSRVDPIGAEPSIIRRAISGVLKVAPDGQSRTNPAYAIPGHGENARPSPVQAAWLYTQMVRWGRLNSTRHRWLQRGTFYRPSLQPSISGTFDR